MRNNKVLNLLSKINFNKPSYEEIQKDLKVFSIIDKFIFINSFISCQLFNIYKINRALEDIIEEVVELTEGLSAALVEHENFFHTLHEKIQEILTNKTLKTKFLFGWGGLESCVYFMAIVYSVHYIEHNQAFLEDNIEDSMLHRNLVINNLKKILRAFKLFGTSQKLYDNCIKILMLLTKFTITKKKIIRVKKKYKTDFYIKLNITSTLNISTRLTLSYSSLPFKLIDKYLVGASHLTLCPIIKKCN